jgi:hypothetical protein
MGRRSREIIATNVLPPDLLAVVAAYAERSDRKKMMYRLGTHGYMQITSFDARIIGSSCMSTCVVNILVVGDDKYLTGKEVKISPAHVLNIWIACGSYQSSIVTTFDKLWKALEERQLKSLSKCLDLYIMADKVEAHILEAVRMLEG